ncbi:MAG: sodium/solute symporter [Archaeoglobaceae archaeon]
MTDPVIATIVIAYFVLSFVIGIIGVRKIKTSEHYFGATRLFGPVLIGIAACASIMSGYGFVGGPGLLYKAGATSVWLTWGAPFGFVFAFWLLGRKLRLLADVRPIGSLPDVIYYRYKSNAARALLALCLLLGVVAYLGTQVLSGGIVVAGLLGVSLEVGIILAFGIVIAYTAIGGMVASILTDFFQGLIMIFAGIAAVIFVLLMTGGTEGLFTTVGKMDPTMIDPLGKGTWMLVLGWFGLFMITFCGQPHLVSKFYTLREYKDLKWSAVLSGFGYLLTSLLWVFVGYAALWLVAKGIVPPLKNPDDAAIVVVSHFPTWMAGVIYAGLLAAIMSTASAFIAIASAAIARDLPKAFGKELDHKKQILWGRVAVVVFTILALIIGYYGGYMVIILGTLGWGYFASAVFPVLVFGLHWKRATREAAIVSLTLALVLNIAFLIIERGFGITIMPHGIPSYIATMMITMATMVFVSLVTKGATGDDIDPDIKAVLET